MSGPSFLHYQYNKLTARLQSNKNTITVQQLAFLFHIHEVLDLNLSLETRFLTDVFTVFLISSTHLFYRFCNYL
jgi:hypothetical protein